MGNDEQRIEAPLVRDYLRRVPHNSRYGPRLSGWIPWIVFFAMEGILKPHMNEGIALLISVAVAWSIPTVFKMFYRPKTDEERSEQEFLDSIVRLRAIAHEGSLRKNIPGPVLAALERCAGARVAALARLAGSDPVQQAVEAEAIEGCMRAAAAAVVPVVRGHDQGKREWEALCANRAVIGAMVDAIQALEDRMSTPSVVLTERLAALRELEEVELPKESTSMG